MLKSLKIKGPFRGPTGYDHHTRQFTQQLAAQGIRIQLKELSHWGPAVLPEYAHNSWFDTLNRDVNAKIYLHFAMPNQVEPDFRLKNVNFTMCEGDRVPAEWVKHNLQHALLILPTSSSKNAWIASGFPEDRIQKCPLGIEVEAFRELPAPYELSVNGRSIESFRHRFLNIAELRPRKNLLALLRVWMSATHKNDDAVLILKSGAYQAGMQTRFFADLRELEHSTRMRLSNAAPLVMIKELLPYERILGLYAAATHYVSMSFGEGWDLPMMEAAASGLQLIAPAHSGYLEYLDPDHAHLLSTKLVPAKGEGQLGAMDVQHFEGINWWKPNEAEAIELFKGIIQGGVEAKPGLRDNILKEYGWEKAGNRLIEILSSL